MRQKILNKIIFFSLVEIIINVNFQVKKEKKMSSRFLLNSK